MEDVVIGIDLGGTYTKFGIVRRSGEVLASGQIATDRWDRVEDFLEHLSEALHALMRGNVELMQVAGIGIGAPNGNYLKGTIEHAANLRWKGIVPFADLFRPHFDCPVYLTNDANAAAIGEMVFGAARGMRDFIVVTLGTGLGSGMVTSGRLLYGHDGFAGELGHTCAIPDGRQCGCGRKGCLETYVSASGICRTFFELMVQHPRPSLLSQESFDSLTSRKVAEAALQGDLVAMEVFERAGSVLGARLADAVAYTSPEAIFLCGGVARAGELLFAPVRRSFEEHLLQVFREKIRILPSGLPEGQVGILGAAALVPDSGSPADFS